MRGVIWVPFVLAAVVILSAGQAAAGETLEARWAEVALEQPLPEDVTRPEGRSLWDWSGLRTAGSWVRRVEVDDLEPASRMRVDTGIGIDRSRDRRVVFRDAGRVGDVDRWLRPHLAEGLLDPERGAALQLSTKSSQGEERFWIRVERAGVGWLHLSTGPRETVLQRALILKADPTGRDFRPDRLLYRWVDPLAGVVAEAEGPSAADGSLQGISAVRVVEQVTRGTGSVKIYSNQLDPAAFSRVTYGFDRKGVCTVGGNDCIDNADCTSGGVCGMIPVSTLTPEMHASIGALGAAPSWDFSGVTQANSRADVASTTAPINANETCSWDKCGFTRVGAKLGREDKWDDLELPSPTLLNITTSVTEVEDRSGQAVPDVTIWIRAGIRNEGDSGGLGTGESRICYVDGGRTEVPLWRFSNQDTGGWFMNVNDAWSSDSDPVAAGDQPFQCENNIFNHVCPNSCGLFCPIYTGVCGNHTGTQYSEVINEGPVTLPSGHTFNALVIKNAADFCAFLGSGCGLSVDEVRTVIYLWEVPWLGTVVRLMSEQNAPDDFSFGLLEEVDIKYGLFPPVSITAGNETDMTLDVSWDPGLVTRGIDRFKIYWDTDSGSVSPYANSMEVPAAGGNAATLSGLTAGQTYYITVTALSDYANPATGAVKSYESLVLPMTAPASPVPLPIEVTATTTGGLCTPLSEVDGLTANPVGGGAIELCWDPYDDPMDPCGVTGYRVLGAATPESDLNFSTLVADNGLATCATVNVSDTYYEVVALGSGGAGPR